MVGLQYTGCLSRPDLPAKTIVTLKMTFSVRCMHDYALADHVATHVRSPIAQSGVTASQGHLSAQPSTPISNPTRSDRCTAKARPTRCHAACGILQSNVHSRYVIALIFGNSEVGTPMKGA